MVGRELQLVTGERGFMAHGKPDAPALARIVITAAILVGFEDQRRDDARLALQVDGDISHVGAAGVLSLTC